MTILLAFDNSSPWLGKLATIQENIENPIAVMLRQWFPKEEDKMYLAEFIDLVHYLNKLFNSRKVFDHQDSEKMPSELTLKNR